MAGFKWVPIGIRRHPALAGVRRFRAQIKARGPKLMRILARRYPEMTFVQIGSNDGRKHDPIHATVMTQAGWRGVLVEPVPYVFKRLQATYADEPRFILENVAIAASSGSADFFHLKEAADRRGLPDWYDELGSFFKDVVLKHKSAIPDIEQRLQVTQVPCLRFEELCARNGITQVGLLHIDTEGYDFEIIKSIDFERHRPRLLIYEHKHLNDQDRAACRSYLEALGYTCVSERQDTWCVDLTATDPSDQSWVRESRRVIA